MTELCAVLPKLGEGDNIPILLKRPGVALSAVDWEVIFVDNDSTDGATELICSIAHDDVEHVVGSRYRAESGFGKWSQGRRHAVRHDEQFSATQCTDVPRQASQGHGTGTEADILSMPCALSASSPTSWSPTICSSRTYPGGSLVCWLPWSARCGTSAFRSSSYGPKDARGDMTDR